MTAVVAQDAGELLTDEERRQVQVKADRDELAVTESRYAEGAPAEDSGAGPCRQPGQAADEVALSASRSELLAHARFALDSPQLVVEVALEGRAPGAAAQHR
jgi:hypothetical protein